MTTAIVTKLVRVGTYCEKLPPLKSREPPIKWSCDFDFLSYNLQVQNANAQSSMTSCCLLFQVSRITAQKLKCSIKDFFSKCDQIRRKLRIWSYLLKEFLMENFIFCAVNIGALMFRKVTDYIVIKYIERHKI